jgi:squamous cell carcinoma antigen recognized by T-cells 3
MQLIQEAGRLLLTPEPIIFSGRELQLIEADLPASARESSNTSFVPRGAVRRPRAGIGSKKNVNVIRKNDAVGSSKPAAGSEPGKGQDDFRRMLNPSS